MNLNNAPIRIGLAAGLLIGGLTVAYQTILSITGLNEVPAALVLFFLFFPAGMVWGLRRLFAVDRLRPLRDALLVCVTASALAAGIVGLMMIFVLGVVYRDQVPPFARSAVARLEEREAAGEDVAADRSLLLEGIRPTAFAVTAARDNLILGLFESLLLSAGWVSLRALRRRRQSA
jgi:hypothetical protein